jgi:glycosyltransferase involved in cell wall biosynthesis
MTSPQEKQILIIGHSFIVDTNRSIWNDLGKLPNTKVDMIVPHSWKSNLIKKMLFQFNPETDQELRHIFPLETFFKGNGSFYFFNPWSLYKILKKEKYDAILLAQETWSLSLLALNVIRTITHNRKTSLFLWVCQNIKKKNLYWLRFMERLNTSTLTSILCCCSEIEEVIQWKGIKNECRYFPFSFDRKNYPGENSPIQVQNIRLGYMGRISEEKGIDKLLLAYDELKKKYPKITLTIAGNGKLVPDIQKRKDITFLGVLPHNEAHLFYQKIDLFILPSQTRPFWKEQFGRVIVESVASGRAIVGSSSGAIPEVMNNLELPYIFQEDSVEDLIRQTDLAINDIHSGKMEKVLEKAKEKVFHLYEQKQVAKRFYKFAFKN